MSRAHTYPVMLRDVRYGLRLLWKSPGFTTVAVLALALGIGANTAIFSVVNAIVLRPLPYRDAGRLTVIWENNLASGWNRTGPSGPNYLDWKEQNRTFEDMAALEHGTATITGFGEPQQLPGMRVTTNYLGLQGLKPALGRDFTPAEGQGGRHNVAIASHGFWVQYLGADPRAIGARMVADGLPYTLIGVLPPDFFSVIPADLLVPWDVESLRRMHRLDHDLGVVGRLKPGVTTRQAAEDIAAIQRRTAEKEPAMRNWGAVVVPLQEALYANMRAGLWLLLVAVGFVLLIACANLANLLLARAAARERETAIRTALGAGRARLVRQYLTESAVLGAFGGALGLTLALWGVDLLERTVPLHIRLGEAAADILRPHIGMDWRVLGFTVLVSVATGILFGLVPAFTAARAGVYESLKEGGRHTTSAAGLRLRSLLVVSEVALALVLLIGAGLTIKSSWRLRQVDPGFRSAGVLSVEMELPTDSRYRQPREQAGVFHRMLERAAALPGVRSAALVNIVPMDQTRDSRTGFHVEGRPPLPAGHWLSADWRTVSPGYFATLGIPLKSGRAFAEQDDRDHPPVAIIDETAARRYWPDGQNPLGQRIRFGPDSVREIVGIVGDVKNDSLDKAPAPTIYVPFLQAPQPLMCLAVRAAGNSSALIPAVKSAVYSVDKDQPLYNIRTMDELVAGTAAASRFTLTLMAVFAAVALVLASVGIYGVMSYAVALRKSEIGIRMALGAQAGDVLAMVVGQGMTLAGAGLAVGLAAALVLTRLLAGLLFGIGTADPGVYAGTCAVLAAVALAACYIPARRAARVDPILCLRYE